MSNAALEQIIEAAWEARDSLSPTSKGEARDAIEATLEALSPRRRALVSSYTLKRNSTTSPSLMT